VLVPRGGRVALEPVLHPIHTLCFFVGEDGRENEEEEKGKKKGRWGEKREAKRKKMNRKRKLVAENSKRISTAKLCHFLTY
jgi:hypothetical protein